jgi:hypothetical protein
METAVFVAEDLLKRLKPNMQVQRNQPFLALLTPTATWSRPRQSKSPARRRKDAYNLLMVDL